MARAARGRPPKVNAQAEQLSAALEFVTAGVASDELWKQHIRLGGNFAVAFNGQIAAGHPIAEELECFPHLANLKAAIAKCGKSLAIAQTPGGKLSIKGDKLNALVPCLTAEDMPPVDHDAPVAPANDALKEAFKVCGVFASEAAPDVLRASVLLEGFQATGTNRHALIQYWHGIDMPPNMVLPKVFAAAVARQTKAITSFGFRWYSADQTKVGRLTLHFDGGAWLSTVCYADNWPDFARILDTPNAPGDIPVGFFEGVAAVAEFNEDDLIVFGDNMVQSHAHAEQGAQYDVPGLQAGARFDGKLLLKVAPYMTAMDYTSDTSKLFFTGDKVRGAIAGVRRGDNPV